MAAKNLFDILPQDFYKPLTSKYREEYADGILLIFNSFKSEVSYGIARESVVSTLMGYFENNDEEMSFDEGLTQTRSPREKANGVLAVLKSCGWLEYEQTLSYSLDVVICDYAIPVIESMNRLMRAQETEYQGLISQVYASLQNEKLYERPYELIIRSVQENTKRLVSELKKLGVNIKRYIERITHDMDANELLSFFGEYQKNIGSKAYRRMKTSENIAFFRNSIIESLNHILETEKIMEDAVDGYMTVEECDDRDTAREELIKMLQDIKSDFYRLDDIIREIDSRHARYLQSIVTRAKFLLANDNSIEGKLCQILNALAEEAEDTGAEELEKIFALYPQGYVSPESLYTPPVRRVLRDVDTLAGEVMGEAEREAYQKGLRERLERSFTRKNVNAFVEKLLAGREELPVTEIEIKDRRDFLRIIYISIYADVSHSSYTIRRGTERVRMGEYSLPYFDIVRKAPQGAPGKGTAK